MIIIKETDTGYQSVHIPPTLIYSHSITLFEGVYYYCLAEGWATLPNEDGVDPEDGGWEIISSSKITYHSGGLDVFRFYLVDETAIVHVGA